MNDYKGLKRTLSVVRGTQHYAAVIAEVLILLSFAMSGLDVSIGGKLASVPWLALFWGITFALGIDTSFVLSWVRVRQAVASKQYGYLWWCIPLALGMSFIVFQPVAIQQLQQSMGITFQQALANLGIDLNFLVYARSFVAVLLGAILAMTNVESVPMQQGLRGANATPSSDMQVMQGSMQVMQAESEPMQIPMQAESLHSQIRALLHNDPTMSQSRIAQQLQVSQSKVSRALKAMQTPVVSSHNPLGMVEQRMYDAFMANPDAANELRRLSQEHSLEDFVAILQKRYSQYASYITPTRVANVMAHIA